MLGATADPGHLGSGDLYYHSESFPLGLKHIIVRLIKLAIISFVILFLIGTAFSLLIPSQIRISKAANFHHSSKQVLMAAIKDQNQWKEWHPAYINDSMQGMKAVNITRKIESDSELVYLMQQGAKPPVTSAWKFYEYPGADSLTLQWYMDFKLKWYPWQKFGSLFFENTYGRMMEEGLTNLKKRTGAGQ